MAESPLLVGLNPAQREAVLHKGAPLLILAGAGSGKTRVITHKIAWLVGQEGLDPQSILAVTFTNKAAGEMRERAAHLEPRASDVLIRTFHSFGSWFLRRNASHAGLSPDFSIYDDDDSVQLLSTLYPKRPKQILGGYASAIARAKDFGHSPDSVHEMVSEYPDLAEVYGAYQKRLAEIGNVDFGDLILQPALVLENDQVIRQRFHQRFKVILVDEYQDSNVAQFRLLKALKGEESYICVVGDDDQSIYRFRGAEVRNILEYSRHFPGTSIIRLEENYRSSREILDLAGAVVANNSQRLGKTMTTRRDPSAKPRLWLFGEQDEEVAAIVNLVRNHGQETAILYRTNAQSRIFEAAFLREGIPYRIVGTLRFYEREEIKDILSLLKLIANPRDEVAFRRMINKPSRGIGDSSRDLILEYLAPAGNDILKALNYAIPSLSKKAAAAAVSFATHVENWARLLDNGDGEKGRSENQEGARGQSESANTEGAHLGVLVERILVESGLLTYHRDQDEVGGTQKQENLEEFLNAAALYPSGRMGLVDFLEATELDAQAHGDSDSPVDVTLITMHNTKGLEFDRVIVSGLEEGVFPRSDEAGEDLEEQRRLLYVALTRARNELYITYTQRKRVFGKWSEFAPSRFIAEMPDAMLDIQASHGYRQAGHRQNWNQPPRDEWSGYDSGFDGGFVDEADGGFEQGCRVSHGDYGTGTVLQVKKSGRTLTIIVEFEDGRRMKFIPSYTSIRRID